MKKINLTQMIIFGLILGIISGEVIYNTASPETAKVYSQEISILTTIFLRMIKMIIAPGNFNTGCRHCQNGRCKNVGAHIY